MFDIIDQPTSNYRVSLLLLINMFVGFHVSVQMIVNFRHLKSETEK